MNLIKRHLKIAFLTIIVLFNSNLNIAQITSVDELHGAWIDDASWDGAIAPPTSTNANNTNIDIDGYIIRFGDLSFEGNNSTITVLSGDTLVVDGNVTLKNNSTISVESGGTLVILGDFTAKNGLDIATNGNIVVVGEFEIANNATVTNNGHIYLYDSTPTIGNNSTVPNIEDEIDLENNDNVLFIFVNDLGSLPVEFKSVHVKTSGNKVVVEWSTATEINNERFEIERTTNESNFVTLGTVAGSGTVSETQYYTFTDKSPINGTSYYRIKQIDYDGQYDYSPVVTLQATFMNATFNVYPTVLGDNNCRIATNLLGDGPASLKIYDLSGNVIHDSTIELYSNQHQEFKIQLKQVESGIHIVVLTIGENTYKRKLIVNKI